MSFMCVCRQQGWPGDPGPPGFSQFLNESAVRGETRSWPVLDFSYKSIQKQEKKKSTLKWYCSEVKITFIPYIKYFVFTVFFLEYQFETRLTEKCNSVQVIHIYLLKNLLALYKTKGQNHITLDLFILVKMYNIQCDSFGQHMTTESSYHIHHMMNLFELETHWLLVKLLSQGLLPCIF